MRFYVQMAFSETEPLLDSKRESHDHDQADRLLKER